MTYQEKIAAILADRPYYVATSIHGDWLNYRLNTIEKTKAFDTERKVDIQAARLNAEHQQAEFEKLIASEKAPLVEALLAVVNATRAYLPPDGIDAQECINRIITATDNQTITPLILEIENGRS